MFRQSGGESVARMTQWPARLVLVGAGKMGGAMALGWLKGGLAPSALTIFEPNPSDEIAALAASRGVALNPLKTEPPDVLALAVKPQSLDAAAPAIAPLASRRTLVLSILAGKTIANLKARLPAAQAFVRAMPNTPAAIGRGVTAAFASPEATEQQRRWSEGLFGVVGTFHWLDDEAAIDAVTAISGGGPAYVFALTEALAAAAAKLGLPAKLSMSLARETVEGAGELMRRESGTSPAILRRNVTSPGGTTAAALAVLQGVGGLDELMARAAAAACARAAEMAG
jgi:pyrroline-5-carboxylate reductase